MRPQSLPVAAMVNSGLAAALGSLAMLIIRDNDGSGRTFGVALAVVATVWLLASMQRSVKQIRDQQSGALALPRVVPVHERDTLARPLGVETIRTSGGDEDDAVLRVDVDLAWRSAEAGLLKRAVVPGLVNQTELAELRRDLKIADPTRDGGRVDLLAKTTAAIDTEQARRAPIERRPRQPRVRAAVAAAAVGASVFLGGAAVPVLANNLTLPGGSSTAQEQIEQRDFDSINEMFDEVLAAAEQSRPGSAALVRSLRVSSDLESVWGTFHDPEQAQDFRIWTGDLDPEYEEDPTTTRGTIDLSTTALPDFSDMILHIEQQASLGAPTGVRIKPMDTDAAAGGEALIELSYGDGPWRYVHARLDGTVAPLWETTDLDAAIDQVGVALADAGISVDDQQIVSLLIAGEEVASTQWLEPRGVSISVSSFLDAGGFQVDVFDGVSWLRILQENGLFVKVTEFNVYDEPQLFALSDVPVDVLSAIVAEHAETSVAESADYATSFVQISRGITDDEDDNLDDADIDPDELDLPIRVLTGYASLPDEDGIYRLDGSLDPGY